MKLFQRKPYSYVYVLSLILMILHPFSQATAESDRRESSAQAAGSGYATTADFISAVVSAFKLPVKQAPGKPPAFEDILHTAKEADLYASEYVHGWNEPITRGEMAQTLAKSQPDHDAQESVGRGQRKGGPELRQ